MPAYRQVMDQLRFFAASGLIRSGDQVPSIRELARVLAVNPGTIVKAYAELEHAGVIESQPGRGYFIAAGPPRLSRGEREAVVRDAARRLWLTASQVGVSAERVHQITEEEQAAFPEEAAIPSLP
jgi:GntR family transcriptional regulator